MRRRKGGLPSWLWSSLGELLATGPDDPSLRSVSGLQGLILEGLNYETSDHNVISVSDQDYSSASESQTSSGSLRFIELRFPSMAIAKRRAAILHMCTWSARHRLAVPLLQSQCCTVLLFAITFCGFGVPTTSLGSRAIVLLSTTCGRGLSDTLARSSGLVDGSLGAAPGEVSGSQRRHGTHEHNPESRGRRSPLRAPASLA